MAAFKAAIHRARIRARELLCRWMAGSSPALTISVTLEWSMLGESLHVLGHGGAFGFEVVGHGTAQARMGDVMCGVRRCRHVATQQFVLALCAGFDAAQTPRDRELDGLVIAG